MPDIVSKRSLYVSHPERDRQLDKAEIHKISEQFKTNHWPQFLEMLEIKGLRGWTGQAITFNFPVVAIVGENGAGKI